VMKMPNGGFNPAVNVQLATDTKSRAIFGVQVSSEGSDSAGLCAPMRQQVEERSGAQVEQHLLDGGYLRTADIEQAQSEGVELFIPPKMAKSPLRRGRELEPKPGDSMMPGPAGVCSQGAGETSVRIRCWEPKMW
jgi:hypothetical protein